MHGLGDSISFGRFMSESLAWEKWSTFSHNRYVEEAERYARPGSVAQKKAFFEAHYKRIASKKAAALLDQAHDDANSAEAEAETDAVSDSNSAPVALHEPPPEAEAEEVVSQNPKPDNVVLHEPPPTPEKETEVDSKPHLLMAVVHDESDSVRDSDVKPILAQISTDERVMGSEAATPLRKTLPPPPPPPVAAVKKDSSKFLDNLENQEMMVPESDAPAPQMLQPQQVQNFGSNQDAPSIKSKKKWAFSSIKSSVYPKSSRVPCSPSKPFTTPRDCIKKEGNGDTNCATTPVITKKHKHALDFVEKKRPTPKSPLRSFINSTPLKQLNNVLSPKPESWRIAPDSSKPSHKCTTPLGLQKTEPSATTLSRHPPASTPCSANTRTTMPLDGNKTAGPKWSILSSVYSKSLTACRNKLQSSTLSTPFILRTEERAARRKQKLEERFNSKEADNKVQQQTTSLKEKAELELRKLRQSFCFKARPLPDFYYKEREAQNNQMKKNLETQPKSPKMGKRPSSRTMQGAVSPPSSTISLHNKPNRKRV